MPRIVDIRGNVLRLAETGVIDGFVHGCNCMHAMGSGIAGEAARRYPEIPEADREQTVRGDETKLGSFSFVTVPSLEDPGLTFEVFNGYTQRAPSYDSSDVFAYDKLPELCQAISESVAECENYTLGIPRIGAGLAGGDWNRIRKIIEDTFEQHGPDDLTLVFIEWDGTMLPPR